MQRHLSAQQLAEKMGITRQRVIQLANAGYLDGAYRLGRDWVFPPDVKRIKAPRTLVIERNRRHREAQSNITTHRSDEK